MADGAVAFRDELFSAGLLIETGVDGLYGRSQIFESVVEAIDRLATLAGAHHRATVVRFPPIMPRAVFEQTDYLRSFPDLTGSIHTFRGDDREHARLLARLDRGEDWTASLTPAAAVLCSAACHPLYPTITGRLPAGGRVFDVYGYCFRHEPATDPTRMIAFRMREFVHVGDPDDAEEHRDQWITRATDLMAGLGLAVEAVVANDPFFGRLGTMLANNQRDEALKYEIVTPIAGERPTAIVSCNLHRDHFGGPFEIETADGAVAHSACVGFGVERIALALLRTHGLDPDHWPAAVTGRLWP
ncbi:MAG: hypothetical protein JWO37_4031 [Acidimicrobiales bacterium]|jgi:seryl-tRNA synthetase|nr:hypothetical protein [Acidimicrobiales bacterium]